MANIAIVGGGVAGLSAGIYALLNGHKATIYERHFKAGGNLTGWDRAGYHIDNCIHWLTGTNPVTSLYRMWNDLGALGNVDIYQAEDLYVYEKDGMQISLNKDINKLRDDMLAVSPKDKKEILAFIRAVKAIMHINGISSKDYTKKSSSAQKLASIPFIARYYNQSIKELSERFTHPLLRGFIASYLPECFSSFALIMVFATFCSENGALPAGASCAMADRIADRFISLGGSLKLRCGVASVNLEGDRASSLTLDDGSVESADYVVIATDPYIAFNKLLDKKYMPAEMQKQFGDPEMRRFSSYHCAFSCDLPETPFHGQVVFEVPEDQRAELMTNNLILREYSHESSFAPEGKNVLQTLTYCIEDDAYSFIDLASDKEAYKAKKQSIAEKITKIITDKYPDLRDKIKCIDVWTPATYRRFTGSDIGAWMSFIFPSGTLPKEITNTVDGIKNVILATQWLQAPGGLPLAAKAGLNAINTILQIERTALA